MLTGESLTRAAAALKAAGAPDRLRLLGLLAGEPGLTTKSLALRRGSTQDYETHALDQLSRLGLVAREGKGGSNPLRYSLSPAGKAVLAAAEAAGQ